MEIIYINQRSVRCEILETYQQASCFWLVGRSLPVQYQCSPRTPVLCTSCYNIPTEKPPILFPPKFRSQNTFPLPPSLKWLKSKEIHNLCIYSQNILGNHSILSYTRGGVVVERSPRMREVGVRSEQTFKVVKTGSDSSTAKRLATGVSVTGPRRWPI